MEKITIQSMAKMAADVDDAFYKEAWLRAAANLGRKALPTVGRLLGGAAQTGGKATKGVLNAPLKLLREAGQASRQAPAVMSSALNPGRAFRYYRDAAGSQASVPVAKQLSSASRNLLRDVAGAGADKKTSVMGDIGRSLWNPSIPTARGVGKNSLPLGKGVSVGRLATAGLLGGAGYKGLSNAHNYLMNQPVTGISGVDETLGPEARKRMNKEIYYSMLPKTLWSGITGQNNVDRRMLKDVSSTAGKQIWNALRSGFQEPSTGVTGKQLAMNEAKRLAGRATQPFKSKTLLQTLGGMPEMVQDEYSDYRQSETMKGLGNVMGAALPQDRQEWSQLANRFGQNMYGAVTDNPIANLFQSQRSEINEPQSTAY